MGTVEVATRLEQLQSGCLVASLLRGLDAFRVALQLGQWQLGPHSGRRLCGSAHPAAGRRSWARTGPGTARALSPANATWSGCVGLIGGLPAISGGPHGCLALLPLLVVPPLLVALLPLLIPVLFFSVLALFCCFVWLGLGILVITVASPPLVHGVPLVLRPGAGGPRAALRAALGTLGIGEVPRAVGTVGAAGRVAEALDGICASLTGGALANNILGRLGGFFRFGRLAPQELAEAHAAAVHQNPTAVLPDLQLLTSARVQAEPRVPVDVVRRAEHNLAMLHYGEGVALGGRTGANSEALVDDLVAAVRPGGPHRRTGHRGLRGRWSGRPGSLIGHCRRAAGALGAQGGASTQGGLRHRSRLRLLGAAGGC
mmetsp:Transcript_60732/g.180912  ORF Transcript_60732/g.180912 Transcript_60732/m.180912 type:complete len:372 (-) Transcript_60732:89-1204(-)